MNLGIKVDARNGGKSQLGLESLENVRLFAKLQNRVKIHNVKNIDLDKQIIKDFDIYKESQL